MRNLLRSDIAKVILLFSLATLCLYLPIIVNPQILLNRGNDLQEYYWPIFYFIKEQILQNHTIPLWNNMFFSGTPLIADPSSFLFYLPNIIFLILPTDYAFIVSLMLHTFFAGVGAYLVAKKGLGLSSIPSVLTAVFYIAFPRTAGFLETGHFPFIVTTTWMPYLLLASINLVKSPNLSWSILLAVSLSGLFFAFPTIFAVAATLAILFIVVSYLTAKNRSLNTLILLGLGLVITIGITAITLFPQVEWLSQTTRLILLRDRDVYPKWNGKTEFIKALYPHAFGGGKLIDELDPEKWVAIGFFISALALIGFSKLQNKFKIIIISVVSGTLLVSLNNVSPIQSLLLSSDWYVLSRVSTRNWFIINLAVVFLAGFGIEAMQKGKLRKTAYLLAFLAVGEMLMLSWMRISRPIPPKMTEVSPSVYEFLKSDPERFRVFCTTRCLSQKDVAQNNVQTIEGYGTIYQKNYYDQFIQLSQVFWDKYSSTLPPISVYNFRQIQPIASIIGEHNVKYVISPYKLVDPDFKFRGQFDKFMVFENIRFKPRVYFVAKGDKSEIEAPVLSYSPNKLVVDITKHKAREVVFAETWSPGWKAKTDQGKKIKLLETPSKLIKVGVGNETQFIELYYYPESYRLGKIISFFTVIGIGLYLFFVLFSMKRER